MDLVWRTYAPAAVLCNAALVDLALGGYCSADAGTGSIACEHRETMDWIRSSHDRLFSGFYFPCGQVVNAMTPQGDLVAGRM